MTDISKEDLLKRYGFIKASPDAVINKTFPKRVSVKSTRYYLGGDFKDTYLTRREAEAMLHLLMGKTMRSTAEAMAISHRTIEFYQNNVKSKLHCRTRTELIDSLIRGQFLNSLGLNDVS